MKIICIGRNYAEHAKELGNEQTNDLVFFLKPDTALLLKNTPFFIPDFSSEIHYEVELVVKINRLGKNIQEKFAHKYYDEIALGIDFTARDLQNKLKAKGLPWEKAKAFDGSAVLSKTSILKKDIPNLENIHFSLQKNGEIVQKGNSNDMVFKIDSIIAEVSKYMTLKIGDLIYTGTPAGVGPIKIGDQLTGFIENEQLFEVNIK